MGWTLYFINRRSAFLDQITKEGMGKGIICPERYLIKQTLSNRYVTRWERVRCWKDPQSPSALEEEMFLPELG